jgi:hypothetical protein
LPVVLAPAGSADVDGHGSWDGLGVIGIASSSGRCKPMACRRDGGDAHGRSRPIRRVVRLFRGHV